MDKYANTIDIRIIRLGKWQIPKSKKIYSGNSNAYLSMGYFDLIDIRSIEINTEEHPLLQAYEGLPRQFSSQELTSNDRLEEYTIQELVVFTNIGENGFSSEQISAFWKDMSLLLFVSLIHVDNDSNIDGIIKKINKIFKNEKYLFYYSFDYSGIVLVSKGDSLRTYLDLMFCLNYQNKETGEKLVRDSYSFYGFDKVMLKEYFEVFEKAEENNTGYDKIKIDVNDEVFSASINIGVQNYNKFEELLETLNKTEKDFTSYGLFGRHDVSIVNDNADLKWILYIQYLLDSSIETQKDNSFDWLFSTHETFVKMDSLEGYKDTEDNKVNTEYEIAKKVFEQKCDTFYKCIEESRIKYNGQYIFPIRAVQCSVLSILKNRFAEDFVLCMYQPYLDFLDYLIEKVNEKDVDSDKFERCYSNFFICINSLVNSAMHSERQFIQATAFNAIIYDVPAKIMAFYMSMIHSIQEIMVCGDKEKKYSFLLTPSFANEIAVEIISYQKEEIMPHNRLLRVSINEHSLYNPPEVICRISHEIAHFVGDNVRNRQMRKEYIIFSLVHICLAHLLHNSLVEGGNFPDLVDEISKTLMKDERLSPEFKNYSENLYSLSNLIYIKFRSDLKIRRIIRNYVLEVMKKVFCDIKENDEEKNREEVEKRLISYLHSIAKNEMGNGNVENISILPFDIDRGISDIELEIFGNLIIRDIEEAIPYINRDGKILTESGWINRSVISKEKDRLLNVFTLGEYSKVFISIYSESFSDIQMILLTNISYQRYLTGFVETENIDVENFIHNITDISRVSMVTMALEYLGIWGDIRNLGEMPFEDKDINKLHQNIIFNINGTEQINGIQDIFIQLKQKVVVVREFIKRTESVCNPITSAENTFQMYEKEKCDFVRAIINLKLLVYLINCAYKSIEHYNGTLGKIDKIIDFRKAITVVNECKDINEVFYTMCEKNKKYKEFLFKKYEWESTKEKVI